MTIARFPDRSVYRDRNAVIKSVAEFALNNDFVINIEKDVNVVFSKCVIRSCSHYLVFRLQEVGWKLVTVDPGHTHNNGIADNGTHGPLGHARSRLPRHSESISLPPGSSSFPPARNHEPSTTSTVELDRESFGHEDLGAADIQEDIQVDKGGDVHEEEDDDDDDDEEHIDEEHQEEKSLQKLSRDNKSLHRKILTDSEDMAGGATVVLGQSEILPSLILKRWPTPPASHLPDNLNEWKKRSHRREGHERLMHLRSLYDGEGDGGIPKLDMVRVLPKDLSVAELALDLERSSRRRTDEALPHLFGSTAKPFIISDIASDIGPKLTLKRDAANLEVKVWDVDAGNMITCTNREWLRYWQDPKAGRAVVTSSSIDDYRMKEVGIPEIVKSLDWSYKSTGKPSAACLVMTTADSCTDWHLDLNCAGTWSNVVSGEKLFCCAPPTPANLDAYYEWAIEEQGNLIDRLDGVYYVVIGPPDTLMIPAGTLHSVYSPAKSLMVSGSYPCDYDFVLQVTAARRETLLRSQSQTCCDMYWSSLSGFMENHIKTAVPGSIRLDWLSVVDNLLAMRVLDSSKPELLPPGFPSRSLIKKFHASIVGLD